MELDLDELYYDALDLLEAMVRIPSVSRDEKAVADLVEERMRQWGLRPQRHNNNVWSVMETIDPTRETLLLNAHLDTVKPAAGWQTDPFEPVDDGERITGLGTNDDGASVVSLMAAYRFMCEYDKEARCRWNLVFLASSEEEVGGKNGIESAVPLLPKIDVALVGEPTGMRPAIAEKGLMVLDGVVQGVSGHAAREEGVNAIYRAMEVVDILRNMRFEKESQLLGPVKVSVTQINAGTQHNVVPAECRMVVDVRTTDAYSNEEVLERLCKAMPEWCTLTARSTRLAPSGISMDHPLMLRVMALGREPFGSPTMSDQALLRVPSLKMGPGESSRSHTAGEYILKSEIREAIETYVVVMRG